MTRKAAQGDLSGQAVREQIYWEAVVRGRRERVLPSVAGMLIARVAEVGGKDRQWVAGQDYSLPGSSRIAETAKDARLATAKAGKALLARRFRRPDSRPAYVRHLIDNAFAARPNKVGTEPNLSEAITKGNAAAQRALANVAERAEVLRTYLIDRGLAGDTEGDLRNPDADPRAVAKILTSPLDFPPSEEPNVEALTAVSIQGQLVNAINTAVESLLPRSMRIEGAGALAV